MGQQHDRLPEERELKGNLGEFAPGASSTFHYSALPSHLQKDYVKIRKAMIVGEDSVNVNVVMGIEGCMSLVQKVLCDNPQIFWIGNQFTMTSYRKEMKIGFRKNRFYKDKEKIKQALTNNAEEIYEKHVKGLHDACDIETAVHDVLVAKVVYDGTDKDSSHSLVGPLLSKKGVCEGISKAAAFLLNSYGVEAAVVTGKIKEDGEAHAWNVVLLGRQWYNTDVTFDLGNYMGGPLRSYLNMNDAMTSRTHEQESKGRCTSLNQNPYVKEGTYYKKADEAVRYIQRQGVDSSSRQLTYNLYVEEDGAEKIIMDAVCKRFATTKLKVSWQGKSGRHRITVMRGP